MNCRFVPQLSTAFFRTAVLLLVVVLVAGAAPAAHAESPKKYFKLAQAAEAREDYDAAVENYQKAWNLKPDDLAYRAAYYRVRLTASTAHVTHARKLVQAGDRQNALTELLRAVEIDPSNEAAQQIIDRLRTEQGEAVAEPPQGIPATQSSMAELNAIGSPAVLKPLSNEPLTLHMSQDAKAIYQAVGKAAGINVLFDPDYTSKGIQIDLNSVSLMDALRIVATMSGTFWRPVTTNTIFVAANTPARHRELDEQAVQTFYLTNAWQQNDLNDVQTALRNVLASNVKVYAVSSQNAIVMRGTPDELMLAQKLIDDLDKARPEVIVDVAILEVSKNWERTLGIAWPSSAGVTLQTSNPTTTSGSTDQNGNSTTTTNPTLFDLSHLKASDFAVSIGTATANLLLNDSRTHLLQNPRIRATDQQKASLKIGSKIPIATGSYQTGAATAIVSSLVNTQFQYQEVGVNIEVTPTVHFDSDVTLKVKIEVSAQSGQSTISGVTEPIFSQRVAEQVVRLREGEANILGGINEKQIQESWSGIPGLSSIPVLRYLFGSKDHTITDDQIVFMLVPHIVRQPSITPLNVRSIDTGSGTSIELRHIAAPANAQPASSPGPISQAPAGSHPGYGTVPGASAAAAAPAAMALMNEDNSTAGRPPSPAAQPAGATSPIGAHLSLVPPSSAVTAGSTFQVPVVLTGGQDIASVPMQVSYDASKLSLVNVDKGDLLGRDGKDVTLLHRDEPPGTVVINAARPPGSGGISGAGVVCVLTFQAKAAGGSQVAISRAGATNAAQQPVPVQGAQMNVTVQ